MSLHAAITGRRRVGPQRLGISDPAYNSWIIDPLLDWEAEGRTAAAVAWDLVQTDPYAMSLVRARVALTLGSKGLRFRSTYQYDYNTDVSEDERRTQNAITDLIVAASKGAHLDAGGDMTRRQLEAQIQTSSIIAGDGIAIKTWKPKRPGAPMATAWRVIHPARVRNPTGVANFTAPRSPIKTIDGYRSVAPGNTIWEGFEITPGRTKVAIWVAMPGDNEDVLDAKLFMRVPLRDSMGNQLVIHQYNQVMPGQIRGFSELAPAFGTLKQIRGTTEAHMVAKRAQASNIGHVSGVDPTTAAAFERAGAVVGPNTTVSPGQYLYLGKNATVDFPQMNYQGSDLKQYLETVIRPVSSMWGLPWQFVLNQLTNANLASSRAALDQAERTAEGWQEDHISTVTSVIDRSIFIEASLRNRLPVSVDEAMSGYYLRPRRWSTDRLKERNADLISFRMGKSPASIFSEDGMDFEEEVIKRSANVKFAAAHGLSVDEMLGGPATNQPDEEPDEELDEEDTDNEEGEDDEE